jgi:diguanylate cyclase (GGDEF)-like protein
MTVWFRRLAVILFICLGTTAVIQPYITAANQSAVMQAKRYDIAWTGVSGRLEASALRELVARYTITGDKSAADEARLYYEIMIGRLNTWNSGQFRQFLEASPERMNRFTELSEILASMEPLFDRLEDREAQRTLIDRMVTVKADVDRIGGEAYSLSLVEADRIRERLQTSMTAGSWLTNALLAVGGVLLASLFLQNRTLATARAQAERSAADHAYVARHDQLTSLPNRLAFQDFFNKELNRKSSRPLAVMAIDLDGFKTVNDTLGHAAGDALLYGVAQRLTTLVALWENAMAARFGGDEFLVVLRTEKGLQDARQKAEFLLKALREPYHLKHGTVLVDATIGLAVDGPGLQDRRQLPENADLALSLAKGKMKGIVQLFDTGMRAKLSRRRQIESDLHPAIDGGDILPFYQPQVELGTGRIIGVEALARWTHPQLGRIGPDEFVPIAEGSGKVVDMGRSILRQACSDAARILGKLPVSVNLSVAQLLRDDLIQTVREALLDTGLAPERLRLEVTESILMSDTTRCISILTRLKQLGVTIALDDFGTGYSSLSYLRQFAWDELKVDRSFVRSLPSDPQSRTIIEAVVNLARELNIAVTVEGVETLEQQALLQKAGCLKGQGYLYGAAVPLEALAAKILEQSGGHGLLAKDANRKTRFSIVDTLAGT